MKKKFRFIYLPDHGWSIAEMLSNQYYAVIGNSNTLKFWKIEEDWGKGAKWGKYIKQSPSR